MLLLLWGVSVVLYNWLEVTLINPRRACAARVTVVVLCVCVSIHTCRLTHWNHKREIPTDSAQYRDRFKYLPIFLKMLRSKVMA